MSSLVTVLVVVAMCSTVLLTTGRATGAEDAVLKSISSASTRSIVVRAGAGSGLDTSVVGRVERLGGVSWVGGFGASVDVSNTAMVGGRNVSERSLDASSYVGIGLHHFSAESALGPIAVASTGAARELGLADGIGGVVGSDQGHFAVVRTVTLPRYLRFLEPVVLSPVRGKRAETTAVSALVVVAQRAQLIAPLAEAIRGVLGVVDLTQISISTSVAIAQIHRIVQVQLSGFNAALLLMVVASTAILVAAILVGLVLLRRRDFGRRRALGASRSLIVGLLLVQVLELALVGSVVGSVLALSILASTRSPLPPPDFVLACAVLAVVASLVGALIPATIASRRDPISELRVP